MKEREALSIAIEREREAYRRYSEAAARTTSESGKKLFSWLASEEKGHTKILEEQWEKVKDDGTWLSEEGYCSYGDISHPIECTEFPSASEVKGDLKENAPEIEIIEDAIAAERQATAFYADCAKNTDDPSGKAMFEKLSKVEQGHLDLLEEEHELLKRSNALFTIHRFTLPSSA